MRAPSTDLLRALRIATLPLAPSRHAQAPCRLARRRCQLQPQPRPALLHHHRTFSTTPSRAYARPPPPSKSSISPTATRTTTNPHAPQTHDRGPTSTEDTQTDFQKMDILASSGVEAPATSIDACTRDGFHLNNGVQTAGGRGVFLVGGEAFIWAPWNSNNITGTDNAGGTGAGAGWGSATANLGSKGFNPFLDSRGILTFSSQAFGLLALLYPKPDLLIFGTGRRLWFLSTETRRYLSEELGMKVDVMDTANAAAAYNLLAMERGTDEVAACLIPEGWTGR